MDKRGQEAPVVAIDGEKAEKNGGHPLLGSSAVRPCDGCNMVKNGGQTGGSLGLASRLMNPAFPGLHFQRPLCQQQAGLLAARLGDKITVQVFAQVFQVERRRHAFAQGILPEIGMGEGP